ncbi:MAG: DJ-1/PfpI family protein [Prevotellaceae bacterium]|nr:DJ-1/PfpI family protein [Prevotellaceae bacterium]
MKKAYIALADGFEEAEFTLPYDILLRAGVAVHTVSTGNSREVRSAHGLCLVADTLLADTDLADGQLLFLPGGMPGSENLSKSEALATWIRHYADCGKWLAAICAAPLVYGRMGLLEGRSATCYPGFENELTGARPLPQTVVRDGQFITGCGPGAGFAMGHALAEVLTDKATADAVLRQMMFGVYE